MPTQRESCTSVQTLGYKKNALKHDRTLKGCNFQELCIKSSRRAEGGGVDIRAIYTHMAHDTSHETTWHIVYSVHLSLFKHKEKARNSFLVLSGPVKVYTASAKSKSS